MKSKKLSLTLIFLLAACAPAVRAPTSTPTATLTPTSTSTPTPPPTLTPTSTPEAWVAIAEEYGMPQEQAKKLEGMNVTLERWTKNVNGVLVKNEAGQDAFWYDPQTEFLVAVDRWPVVTDIHQFEQNQISTKGILSDEFFAWLKFLLSELGPGVGPDINISDGEMYKFTDSKKGVSFLINYPGLVNKGVTYANLKADVEGDSQEFRVIVNAYEFQGKKYPVILVNQYRIEATPEWNSLTVEMLSEMKRLPILTEAKFLNDAPESILVKASHYNLPNGDVAIAMENMQQGDPTVLSQPGVIFLTFPSEGELFDN